MRPAGAANGAGTAADGAAATAGTADIAPAVAAASGSLSGRAARAFRRFLEAFKDGAQTRLAAVGSMAAIRHPGQLPGGAERPESAQLVLWGHAERNGSGSDGCWEPRCASARAFAPPID